MNYKLIYDNVNNFFYCRSYVLAIKVFSTKPPQNRQ